MTKLFGEEEKQGSGLNDGNRRVHLQISIITELGVEDAGGLKEMMRMEYQID